jgi:hypothetical protein
MKTNLKPYMASGDDSEEGAILVFAHNAKEAKLLAWHNGTIREIIDGEYLQLRVSWMKHDDFMFKEADQEKLNTNIPHIVESPTTCNNCDLWGLELNENGYCEDCAERIKCENCQHTPEPNGEIDCFKCEAEKSKVVSQ